MIKTDAGRDIGSPRDRLISATSDLIAKRGVSRVGIEEILESANCAKASLYDNFGSKTDLIVAALDHNYEQTTQRRLFDEVAEHVVDPEERLLSLFDIFHDFFGDPAYPGCASIKAMLETDPGTPIHNAAKKNLARLRSSTLSIVTTGTWHGAQKFASVWYVLMAGAIVSAAEGRADSALYAKEAAMQLLDSWPKDTADVSISDLEQL